MKAMIIGEDPVDDARHLWGVVNGDFESLWAAWRKAACEILRTAGLAGEVVRVEYGGPSEVRTFTFWPGPRAMGTYPITIEGEIWRLAHDALDYDGRREWKANFERAQEFGRDLARRLARAGHKPLGEKGERP